VANPRGKSASACELGRLLETLATWAGGDIRVVPAHGKVTDGKDLKAFRDMILTVRSRVQPMGSGARGECRRTSL